MKKRLIFIITLPINALAVECPVDELAAFTTEKNHTAGEQLYVEADQVAATDTLANFTGNVIAKQGDLTFRSHQLDYNRVTENINVPIEATYGNADFALRSTTADYSLKNELGHFKNVDYYLSKDQANGSAEHLTVNQKNNTKILKQATYTTCARNNPGWHLKAKEIRLNHDTGVGETWHTTFHIGKTPVMYLPYLNFPINDQRKTGFLFPSLNYSNARGVDITLPYYINIAPNHDATISPRIMSNKGLMLGGEYRYLFSKINGTVAGTYLVKDKSFGDKRWSFKTTHAYRPTQNFSIDLNYQRVSDKYYIHDFEGSLDLSNTSFLESRLNMNYQLSPNYRLAARVSNYQVADRNYTKADKPYNILPQVTGYGRWTKGDWTLSSETDATHFSKYNAVSGVRLNQKLDLSYLYETSYAFVKPSLIYRFTSYQLRDQAAGVPKNITRSIPTFSIDSGLYFDRQVQLFGRSMTQTLSPRLFYLYTPYKDQSNIPIFDSGLVSSTYNALFLNNRFNGKDRIGDANQLTTAVSTSFTDNDSGRELAKFSLGQIQYFQDRRVSLNNAITQTPRSNIIAEASLSPHKKFKLQGLLHYDTNNSRAEKSLLGVSYFKEKDKVLHFTHTYDQTYFKQIDFSGIWRLNDNWRTFWRWNYAVDYSKTIDMLAGVEYADCCWGVRLMARQKRTSVTSNEEPENTVFVEFVLKGLGNLGSDTGSALRNVIPNYQPIQYEGK